MSRQRDLGHVTLLEAALVRTSSNHGKGQLRGHFHAQF